MMKGKKRFLSLLLTGALTASMVGTSVYAEDLYAGHLHDHVAEYTEGLLQPLDQVISMGWLSLQNEAEPEQNVSGTAEPKGVEDGPKIVVTASPKGSYYETGKYYIETPSVTISDDNGLTLVKATVDGNKDATKFGSWTLYGTITEDGKKASVNLAGTVGEVTITATNVSGKTSTLTFKFIHLASSQEKRITYEANCTQPERVMGMWFCRLCGQEIGGNAVPVENGKEAKGHTFEEEKKTVCGGGEVTVKTCTVCGHVEVEGDDHLEDGEHTWVAFTKPATCTETGAIGMKCSKCGITKDETVLNAKGHYYNTGRREVTLAADCEKQTNGTGKQYCAHEGCTSYLTYTIAPQHTYGSLEVIKPATCEDTGLSGYKCTKCGYVNTSNQRVVPALGHDYSEDNDCTTPSRCTRCGKQLEGNAEHNLVYKHDDQGHHWQECENDGCEYSTEADKTGHTRPADAESDCTAYYNCADCGALTQDFASHQYSTARYEADASGHWRPCEHEGCTAKGSMARHSAWQDNNCLTEDRCLICGFVVREGHSEHKPVVYGVGSNGHSFTCGNQDCYVYHTVMQEHTVVNDHDCTTADRCSVCGYVVRTASNQHDFSGQPYLPDENGQGHYQVCKNGDCEQRSDVEEHSGGTATCKAAAVCEICGHSYGNKNATNHDGGTKIDNVREATETQPGYTGDTICLGCNEVIKKGEEIPVITPEHVHEFQKMYDDTGCWEECNCGVEQNRRDHLFTSASWRSDAEGHWQICDTCGYATSKVLHKQAAEDYDCTTALLCTECGYEIEKAKQHDFEGTYAFDESGHWLDCENPNCSETSDKVAHNAVEDGNCTTELVCPTCKHVLQPAMQHEYSPVLHQGDEQGHYQICEHAGCTEKKVTAHTPSSEDGNCETAIVCTECQFVITPAQKHSFTGSPYTGDGTQHWLTCQNPGCEARSSVAVHTGGTANCRDQAICEVCGQSYGEKSASNHVGGTEILGHRNPTTEEEGYSGDIYCLGCGECIEYGKPLDILPAGHQHNYTFIDFDGTHHWLECNCGIWDESSITEHSMGEWEADADGHWKKCSGCAYIEEALQHTPKADDYDCSTPVVCGDCGYVIEEAKTHVFSDARYAYDAEGHWHVCQNSNCTVTGEKKVHHAKEDGDCTTSLVCEDCGYILKEAQQHDFTGDWVTDENGHWDICENVGCNIKTNTEKHTGGTATCAAKAVCEVCGVVYGELDEKNHIGEWEIRNALAATETENGYTGDKVCLGCGEILEKGKEIPASGSGHEHVFGDTWEYDSVLHWHMCSCFERADAASHTMKDGKCTVCGYVDSSNKPEKEPTPESKPTPGSKPGQKPSEDLASDAGKGNAGEFWMLMLLVSFAGLTETVFCQRRKKDRRR